MKVGSSIDSTSERTSNVRINATKRFIPRNFQATCGILLGIAIWATAAGGRVDQGQGIQELLSNSREKKNVLKLIDERSLWILRSPWEASPRLRVMNNLWQISSSSGSKRTVLRNPTSDKWRKNGRILLPGNSVAEGFQLLIKLNRIVGGTVTEIAQRHIDSGGLPLFVSRGFQLGLVAQD